MLAYLTLMRFIFGANHPHNEAPKCVAIQAPSNFPMTCQDALVPRSALLSQLMSSHRRPTFTKSWNAALRYGHVGGILPGYCSHGLCQLARKIGSNTNPAKEMAMNAMPTADNMDTTKKG